MTSEVTQAALDPCPFCGGEAEEANSKGPTGERYRWVQCADCGAMTECCDDSARHNNPDEPEPVDLWNTRLTAQSGEGRSGAGEEFLTAYVSEDAKVIGIEHDTDADWRKVHDAHVALRDRLEERIREREKCPRKPALNARQSGEGEREALREALAEAYRKGATDVHNYWVNNPGEPPRGDPEFGESASDYAAAALDIFDSAAALRAAALNARQSGDERLPLPTRDAYARACRALRWRHAQLRAHGIEPIQLTDEHPPYPPEDYDFKAAEADD